MGFIARCRKTFASSTDKDKGCEYWRRIHATAGGDEGLRTIILTQHAGMGIVAALVLTIAVGAFLVSPVNYRESNDHNASAAYVANAALAVAFFLSVYTINGSFQISNQTMKVPACNMLEWVLTFKGNPRFEYAATMSYCVMALAVAVLAMVYAVHGPIHFYVVLGIGCSIMLVDFANAFQINEKLVDLLFDDSRPVAGGAAGAGGAARGASIMEAAGAGGELSTQKGVVEEAEGKRVPVRIGARVHPDHES